MPTLINEFADADLHGTFIASATTPVALLN